MYRLIIEDDEGNTTAVTIVRDEITIGRKEGNTIRLTERNISRYHSKLRRVNAQLIMEDLDSYNGVKVNGLRITGETPLNTGDIINIGDYFMTVREDTSVSEEDILARVSPPATPPESRALNNYNYPPLPNSASSQPIKADGSQPQDIIKQSGVQIASAHVALAESIPLSPPYAKFIVLTSDIAGESFTFEVNPSVLGSGKNCNPRIDLPSIADEHLIVELIEDKYFIEVYNDQVSAPLVNGGAYERTALQPGDIIEIGKVKLRFVAPREKYGDQKKKKEKKRKKFGPKNKNYSSEEANVLPQTNKWAAIRGNLVENMNYILPSFAVGILIGFLFAFVVLPGGEKGETAEDAIEQAEKQAGDAKTTAVTGEKEAQKAPERSPFEIANDVVEEAQKFINQGKYADAAKTLDEFMVKFARHKAARAPKKLLVKVNSELENKKLLDKGIENVENELWDEAWDVLTQITPDSDFNGPAIEILTDVKAHKVSEHLNNGDEFRDDKKYKEALGEYKLALMFDEANEDALQAKLEIEKKLNPGAKKRRSSKSRKKASRPREPQRDAKQPEKSLSPKELVSQGNKMFLQNKLNPALKYYRKAIQKNPRYALAYRGMGITYAKLGKASKAVKAYEKYLALSPKASDANQVRKLVRDYYRKNPQ